MVLLAASILIGRDRLRRWSEIWVANRRLANTFNLDVGFLFFPYILVCADFGTGPVLAEYEFGSLSFSEA
jgi:hypothetical protein